MKFRVDKLKEAKKEYDSFSKKQQKLLDEDYRIISTKGLNLSEQDIWLLSCLRLRQKN